MTMLKQIFLFSLLLLPLGSWAQTIAEANQSIIDTCGKSGGKMTSFTAGKCEFQRCVYEDNKSDGKYYRSGDNKKTNCTPAELKVELDKISTDLDVNVTNGNTSGSTSGSGNTSGSTSGSGNTSGSTSGSGNTSGSTSGSGDGGVGGIQCEYVTSGILSSSHACAKYCKKHWLTGKEGAERKKCRDCIEKYSVENGGDLVVDWSKIPGGKPNKHTVVVGGVQVRTGEIICYDIKTGAIVSRTGTGSLCPSGSSTSPGGVVINGGATSGSGNGGVVINGGGSVSGNGGLPLPSFCQTGKKRDQKKCDAWLVNNARFQCSSSGNAAGCMGTGHMNDVQSRYSTDCVNCGGGGRKRDNSWIGDALTGLFVSAGGVAQSYFNGQAYVKGQEAWAGAAAVGFEQCQIHNNNYLQYTISQELPAVSPEQQAAMGCNGFGINQYAGMGYGGMGAWNGAGYSNGYLGGMMGPYGGYNPYGGMGGMVGGAVGGYPGGMAGGYAGGYPGGIVGGIGIGIGQGGYAGGYPGGMAGGYPGGYGQGGYAGGYPGGMVGGIAGGIGIGQGGYAGGYPGGMAGGYGQGGYAGGYPGGMAGGYGQGGYAGGYPGGMAGGYGQGGYGQGGYGQGGYPGGYGQGGWGSGTGQWGGQGNYWASSQASNYDQMLQGQGISYQMGMAGGGGGYNGYGSGYGSAGFNPMNAGMNFNAGFNAGFGGGW